MRISLITATYNNSETVLDTLSSVAEQTHRDIEYLVIDGASTDGTLDILRAHRSQIDVLVSEPDRGIYDALNKALSRASGEVVGFLHADDVFADEEVLSAISKRFSGNGIDAAYGDLVYVDNHRPARIVRYWNAGTFSPTKLAWGWMPPHPTFYVRRSVYERLGAFDTSFRIAADYDCMLRFLGHGISVAYIPRVLVKMRLGGASNKSIGNMLRKSREDYRALRTNDIGGLGALICKNLGKVPQFLYRGRSV
jgi:glycosyltransferase